MENADFEFNPSKDPRYSYSVYFVDYVNIGQKWVDFHSNMMHDRQEKTFELNLKKDFEKIRISL
jgi:transposase